MLRDKLWMDLYQSPDLIKAAKFLTNNSDLWQDLLTDSLIKFFEKSDSELFEIKVPKNFVFFIMRNYVYGKAWKGKYITNAESSDECLSMLIHTDADFDPIEITEDEAISSDRIFSRVTHESILLMRKIDEADNSKLTNRKFWNAAQYMKLYIDPEYGGSLRKVENSTGIGHQQVRNQINYFTSTLMDKKIKVTYVTYGSEPRSGMELYRLHYPYMNGIATNHADQFTVSHSTYGVIAEQAELESDVYVCSRVRFPEVVDKIISQGKKLVVDIDDYWELHKDHPILHNKQTSSENAEYVVNVTYALSKAHMVTTTTDILAYSIKQELGIDAVVIKNTIPEYDVQFTSEKYSHWLVRFGYIGGNHHSPDIAPMFDGMKRLHSDPQLVGKYQITLGGFSTAYDNNGKLFANPHFAHYEKVLTANYHAIRADAEYKDYLLSFSNAIDHITYNKVYRRMWNMPVTKYGNMYRNVDVAFIPLGDNKFNSCKSELKLIEAGMTGTAAIVSDVLPYANHLQHEMNCLKVNPKRNDWYSQTRRLILDADLRNDIAKGLSEYVRKNFNHVTETKKLAKHLTQLTK